MITSINNQLSAQSRTWVYQSNRKFTDSESAIITNRIKDFVAQWTSHKMGVTGYGELLFNRFIILMADENHVEVGGCSVDSSVHFVRSLGNDFQVNFFDRWLIAYKQNDEVITCPRAEFEKLVESGQVNDETIVFNNLVQTKAELETKWQLAYKDSWLKNLGPVSTSFSGVL